MSIGEQIRDAIVQSEPIGVGAALALRRCPPNWSSWCLKAHSDAVGTSIQSIAGPYVGTLSTPTVASALGLASTSANDTSGGTGARTVRVIGLSASYAVQTEDVTLSGQTKVTTSSTFIAVNGLYVLTAGSGGANAGHVYVADDGDTFTAGVPTAPYLVLEEGWNVAAPGTYTIPDGYSVVLSEMDVSGDNGKTVTVILEIYNSTQLWERRFEMHVGSGNGRFMLSEAIVGARDRMRVRGLVSTGTGQVMVQIHGVLVEDE